MRVEGIESKIIMTKKTKTKYKKAPQAPRRFKSAYMFFSTVKHREIREELGTKGMAEKTTNIAKLVSQAWKDLNAEDREKWDEMARKDKLRFEVEKSLYTGPWKVPAKKLSQKDPNAPKRPMSAFLAYSHAKRAAVKAENEGMNNAEISRVLATMWKEATEEEKKEYIDEEYKLRQKYLSEIAVWRERTEKELADQRSQREEIALQTVAARANGSIDTQQHLMHHPQVGGDPTMGGENHQGLIYDKDGRPTAAAAAARAAGAIPPGGPQGSSVHDDYYSAAAASQYYAGQPPPPLPPHYGRQDMSYPPSSYHLSHTYEKFAPTSTVTPPSVPEYFEGVSYPPHMGGAAVGDYYSPHSNYGYYGYPPPPDPGYPRDYPPYGAGGYPGMSYADYPPHASHAYSNRVPYDHSVPPSHPPPPPDENYDRGGDSHYRQGGLHPPSIPPAEYHHQFHSHHNASAAAAAAAAGGGGAAAAQHPPSGGPPQYDGGTNPAGASEMKNNNPNFGSNS